MDPTEDKNIDDNKDQNKEEEVKLESTVDINGNRRFINNLFS